ncbi:MAG: biotin/lipoyl-containing protein [Myxococcota bacterium]
MATYKVKSQGVEHTVTVVDKATGGGMVTIGDQQFDVEFVGGDHAAAAATSVAGPVAAPLPIAAPASAPSAAVGPGSIVAPIPGKIVAINVSVGDTVTANQVVLKLEAMKMENDIATPSGGTVKEIAVSEGAEASAGQLLMVIG